MTKKSRISWGRGKEKKVMKNMLAILEEGATEKFGTY